MAGPTSSVLLRIAPDSSTIALVYKVIDDLATKRTNNDFYINSTLASFGKDGLRPFGVELNSITNDYYNYSESELKLIEDKFKFYPKYDIGLYAMCNDIVDHKILGQLTLKIAEAVDGIIEFGGRLDGKKIKNVNGKICEIDYETAIGRIAQHHVSDIEFMRNWLLDKSFYMIK
ncbi:MAG TPA: DUF6368 family protein [Cyclobacteriaceae bacterium]|nr:DUF6368 family protein [Cyclobacteriaceae bacterium]